MVRSASALPAVLLATCGGLLVSLLSKQTQLQLFLTAAPGNARAQGRTAMNGFKDDFMAWKSTLSGDEQKLLLKQAQGEFNKKFRKSDDFSKDISQDKIASFGKVLQKFFESEAEDYKKEIEAKIPDYDKLKRKAANKVYDFSLRKRIVEINRDADRRYQFAMKRIAQAQMDGEQFPQNNPFMEKWAIMNNDTESHATAQKVLDNLVAISKESAFPKEALEAVAELEKSGVPPMGTEWDLVVPQAVAEQFLYARWKMSELLKQLKEDQGEAAVTAYAAKDLQSDWTDVLETISKNYHTSRDLVNKDAEDLKAFFRSQREMPGKTKADVLKEIWAELPKVTGKPMPPLDEEILAEFAKRPAVNTDPNAYQFKHSWGTADKLYKSEAIDSFGQKYLLGVYETQAEATKAFDSWNVEYDKARASMKDEITQWGKQEQARMDADTAAQDRVRKALEEARR